MFSVVWIMVIGRWILNRRGISFLMNKYIGVRDSTCERSWVVGVLAWWIVRKTWCSLMVFGSDNISFCCLQIDPSSSSLPCTGLHKPSYQMKCIKWWSASKDCWIRISAPLLLECRVFLSLVFFGDRSQFEAGLCNIDHLMKLRLLR